LLAYRGSPIIIDKLLYQPKNSLINQSINAKELEEPLNGDGFGIGWYVPDVDDEPATFVSVLPAWNNRNLLNLAPKVRTTCLFAHVRAASVGDVSEANCHPFQYKNLLMMHNGGVENFGAIKRAIRNELADEFYNWIRGQTDSEHIFSHMLNQLLTKHKTVSQETVVASFEHTFRRLSQLMAENGISEPAYLNMVFTNGEFMVGTRYVSDPSQDALTLYHSEGSRYICEDGVCRMLEPEDMEKSVLVVSEKLTDVPHDWKEVPKNHFVIVDKELKVGIRPIMS
ncbi:MAG: class II glutamine amidotransferase, partial [Bacteroidia bacterium]|nr:class II glutamine amidotransferase [Bacteroidia bacterium]